MRKSLTLAAAVLAAALAAPAAAQAPGGGATINLRDYWILAEIRNPTTLETVSFRVDCSSQSPLECTGGTHPLGTLATKLAQQCGFKRGKPIEGWPAFIRAELVPFFPGIVGYVASGAGGFAVGNAKWLDNLVSKPAAFPELRRADGFSVRISSTRADCGRVDDSDIRLTMWLVTPEELAEREAAADKTEAPAAPPKRKGRRR